MTQLEEWSRTNFSLGGLSRTADLHYHMMLSQLVAIVDCMDEPKTLATLSGNC